MDDYSNRRIAGRFVLSRKEPDLILRGSAESDGYQNDQACSQVGCTSRVNSVKNVQIGSPRRAKTSKSPFRSFGLSWDTRAGSSGSSVSKTSKSSFNPKMKFPIEVDSEESEEESQYASISLQSEVSVNREEENHEDADATTSATTGKLSLGPAKRSAKTTHRFGSGHEDSSASSSNLFALKKNNKGGRNGSSTSTGTSRYNLKSFGCNSISDVVPSGSASFSHINRKRIGESKSANRDISISASRQRRNLSPRDNETVSLRMPRLNERTHGSSQETSNRLSLDANAFSPENRFLTQNAVNRASSFSRMSGVRDCTQSSRSLDLFDGDIGHSYMNYNLDALAEMLLALERFEQAEETTYEELLVDANLFLGGLALHDRHRDMRLDIDNMSYEELLTLEERMGTVSTAVPEEALVKCLKRSTYQGTSDCVKNDDDVNCSICQEEYGNGDETGRLGCEHRYHIECIHQWLRLKNWCPICKAAVEPSPPQS